MQSEFESCLIEDHWETRANLHRDGGMFTNDTLSQFDGVMFISTTGADGTFSTEAAHVPFLILTSESTDWQYWTIHNNQP